MILKISEDSVVPWIKDIVSIDNSITVLVHRHYLWLKTTGPSFLVSFLIDLLLSTIWDSLKL